jgi:hypothetical protein
VERRIREIAVFKRTKVLKLTACLVFLRTLSQKLAENQRHVNCESFSVFANLIILLFPDICLFKVEWKTQKVKVPKVIQVQETVFETKMVPIQVVLENILISNFIQGQIMIVNCRFQGLLLRQLPSRFHIVIFEYLFVR